MYFELAQQAQHTGTETYTAAFALKEQGDRYDVRAAFVQYEIRPERVTLVWERYREDGVLGPWHRVGYRPRGAFSAFVGPRVLKDGSTSDSQSGVVEVFGYHNKLTDYAASFPHLEQMIEELEKQLPQ